ncbi:hypothetical protein LZZ90_10160 [Flavobacterium sp. SM15]|uniref:DUF4870 domain-containing protein n=1 Tax=Flavobacterium sp. SM15 TaxID=2908005 RepID=UPI001EDC5157|nr:hypothetical protein [Flavobacterium sp. SM15]MCG2611868.1 hypothetical protein [Flavobacterium sp. SM15]
MENNTVEEGKTTAIISYITIIGTLIAILMNNEKKNPFASFHNRQALGINLMFYIIGYFVGYFDSWAITIPFYVFCVVLWVFGFVGAVQGEQKITPLVGNYFQDWFKNL